jgi:hypothetical protein
MKRRKFVTTLSAVVIGSSLNINNNTSLAVEVDVPTIIQTDLSDVGSFIITLDKLSITPDNINDNKDLNVTIESTVDGEYIGEVKSFDININEGQKTELDGISCDIIKNGNTTSNTFDSTDGTDSLDIKLDFIFEHPQIVERATSSVLLTLASGEFLPNNTSFESYQGRTDIGSIQEESILSNTGGEMNLWSKSRSEQIAQISSAPNFNNYSSYAQGVYNIDGSFDLGMTDEGGESKLSEPSSNAISGDSI